MNLQILSNSKNQIGKENYTNDFTMSLKEPVDAENKDVFIKVKNVTYPLTTKNILNDTCYFSFSLMYGAFKFNSTTNVPFKSAVRFTSDKIVIPNGIYSIEKVIKIMNAYLDEYDIFVEYTNNGKIDVNVHKYIEFWFQQFKSRTLKAFNDGELNTFQRGDKTISDRYFASVIFELTFSDKLKFMLGFNDNKIESVSFLPHDPTLITFTSEYLPDPSDGINKIFIYCDQVEKTIVGDSKSELLAIVPLQLKGQGSGQLFTFTPPETYRKLIKSYINHLHVYLCDSTGELISFDSGTVDIECEIKYD